MVHLFDSQQHQAPRQARPKAGARKQAIYVTRAVWRASNISLILIGLVFRLGELGVNAQDPRQAEYELKAAYLYKFASFVDWPTNKLSHLSDPMILGVLGDDSFGDTVERTIDTNPVHGRKLIIQRLKDATELKGCHILFISTSEKKRLPQILESVQGASVLTVGETEEFCQLGGVINLKKVNKNLRFEVNPAAADRAHLKISSQLLKLAILIKEEGKERRN